MQVSDWHNRYRSQAQWTQSLRQYIFNRLPSSPDWQVLEIGSGTGAVLEDAKSFFPNLIGLDHNLHGLAFTKREGLSLVNADANALPFITESFDFVFCHYFLLWQKYPESLLEGLKPFLKPNAFLAALAEPDYLSRVSSPPVIERLAHAQNEALLLQGARLDLGAQLGDLLRNSGYKVLEYGHLFQSQEETDDFNRSEYEMLRQDLAKLAANESKQFLLPAFDELINFKSVKWFVPTYYALAQL